MAGFGLSTWNYLKPEVVAKVRAFYGNRDAVRGLKITACLTEMSELLFECYRAPKVAYFIDGLASHFYNSQQPGESTASCERKRLE